ncbi:hypothetical protein NC651_025306 [Populus alba x Populus x berolinensis]|nr:hypothetical protein NC651_025306 [Populus alba x Populus x berolinensis]
MGFNCVGSAWKAAPLLGLWLACVLMTLNATGINNCSIQALAGLGCTNRTYYTFRISKVDCKNIFNTWNIVSLISWKAVDECRPGSSLLLGRNLAVDLAYLLQKHSVSFSHYTITLGANPNYFTRNNCLRILCNWMCYFKRHEEKALIYRKSVSFFVMDKPVKNSHSSCHKHKNMRGYRQNAMEKRSNPLAPKEIVF